MKNLIACTGIFLFSQHLFAADRLPVFVSIVPQKYFVQQIGRDLVDVRVMVQPGANPATYEPKPRQMADLSKTKIYFSIGVPFEKTRLNMIAATNPDMKIVPTDHDIEKIPMAAHHHHDEEGAHPTPGDSGHGGLDPHIWLSPPLVKTQANTILTALVEIDPSHKTSYEANFHDFVSRIDELDAELRNMFADKQGMRFLVFHPSWGYFAHAYGLEQVPIEIEGKNPKPAELKELIELARSEGIKVVFVQPQFSTKSALLVAREIGGRVVVADPLAEDWLVNLQDVADKFNTVLK
jgi:zinc transport system substrate-binding protein